GGPDPLAFRDVRRPEALLQIGVHLLVDVDGIDAALRADRASEAQREVAAPRAEVGHALARLDAERLDHALGLLPRVATGVLVAAALPRGAAGEQARREEQARRPRTRPQRPIPSSPALHSLRR